MEHLFGPAVQARMQQQWQQPFIRLLLLQLLAVVLLQAWQHQVEGAGQFLTERQPQLLTKQQAPQGQQQWQRAIMPAAA